MDNNHEVVTELPELDCWELLRQQEFGRLAFHLVNEVHIVPINYVVHRGRIVFRTAEGSKLLGITMNHDVAFEIDHYDEEQATSVVVRGTARELQGEEADQAENLPLRPWVPTAKFSIVEIKPVEVTGRLFRLDRPWSHMRPAG
ncbi:pyridoxamine 5'-phosphate oxidase family protein [Knoellia sp. 3-2P3]|uniref:pyridoxamine 5'-phosphate oxidase family protein n=1 Tax=unclassified Knoellia TaxID=2618719 RepID=UPI0023D97BB9|nr:pyridoxamine 5'-phosphate oxidase family protein [Knoellia sp. 3-2P3]MDF2093687.1 pyridoxamine 5'-phosphate oxidase family protein [Knoellia sp. 3-2P3]